MRVSASARGSSSTTGPDMTGETKQPARMGRPTLPDDLKTKPHTVYLTDAQWAKVQERGLDWLRALIDKAK